jgi:hypothetical protein
MESDSTDHTVKEEGEKSLSTLKRGPKQELLPEEFFSDVPEKEAA